MSLAGQTAIVTGGNKGIGRAICFALAKEGANIVIAARNESESRETLDRLKGMGSKAFAVQVDVRSEEDVRRLIATTVDKCGGLDIFVNNAGMAYKKRLEETTLEEYDEIMDTNLKGVFLCTKYAIPYIRRSKNGKIINISSIGGLHGVPEFSVYCGSKFGVNGITEAIASELEREIKVYSVCPGAVGYVPVILQRQTSAQTRTYCRKGSGTCFARFKSCIRENNRDTGSSNSSALSLN